jgi:hypothetical protein
MFYWSQSDGYEVWSLNYDERATIMYLDVGNQCYCGWCMFTGGFDYFAILPSNWAVV